MRRIQWRTDDTDLAINREILAALLRSDLEVKGDYHPKSFHQRFILGDHDGKATPTSALLSGSANLPWTDTHSNLNNVVVFHNASVCRQYQAEVEQLQRASFGRGLHGEVPRTYDLSGVPPVGVLFAPDHTPELEIMKQLLKGVLDPGQAAQDWAAPKWLKHPNIELYVPKRAGVFARLRKLHHKLMVIDERIVVAGSFNDTQPANEYNDENIFAMGSTHKKSKRSRWRRTPAGSWRSISSKRSSESSLLEQTLRPRRLDGRARAHSSGRLFKCSPRSEHLRASNQRPTAMPTSVPQVDPGRQGRS